MSKDGRGIGLLALTFTGLAGLACHERREAPATGQPLELVGTSLASRAAREINRPIELEFSAPVDFDSVGPRTVRIETTAGVPATGSFAFATRDEDGDGVFEARDERTIVFQPTCPREPDLSDAGLRPSSSYVVRLPGAREGASEVLRSRDGRPLEETVRLDFTTREAGWSELALFDAVPGPPTPLLRTAGSEERNATHWRIGGDEDERVYVEVDPGTWEVAPASFRLPLNLHGDPTTRVTLRLALDQPVDPRPENLDASRVRFEFEDAAGTWRPMETRSELVSNCPTSTLLEVEPVGVLPSGGRVRVVLSPGFKDAAGESLLLAVSDFATASTRTLSYPSLSPAEMAGDEVRIVFGETGGGEAALAPPGFSCTGGPGGNFDWVVPAGSVFFFDTVAQAIVGGPNGVPTAIQNTVGGLVEVRDLVVEEGATIRVLGPNPMRICASGTVTLEGTIDVSGFDAKDVATLNTGNQPEVGGSGGPGGAQGGGSSQVTNNSTPRGGMGAGLGTGGGQGGESGYADFSLGKDARRPGGGGGGRFAADQGALVASAGVDGHPLSTGAESGVSPAAGGAAGTGPFQDDDDTNDFFGTRALKNAAGEIYRLVRGELPGIWGGAGGGGGGDAVPASTFPNPSWTPASDEKGGPGGGGGGALHVRAIGPIVFGAMGTVRSNGGRGALGENTAFLDHVGGTGGSGSGGHVLLESAEQVDFTGGDPTVAVRDWIEAVGGPMTVGPKGPANPPVPCGISHGGSGGPGVIQLHVPGSSNPPSSSPTASIVVPDAALLGANPLDEVASPAAIPLRPFFDGPKVARSAWIPLGAAGQKANGRQGPVSFLFGGLETEGPDAGRIETESGRVVELEPLLGPLALASDGVALAADGMTIELSGAALAPLANVENDLYLRTPALLSGFGLRLEGTGARHELTVTHADYDDGSRTLSLTAADGAEVLAALEVTGSFTLVPRFFRVRTEGVQDVLPEAAHVRILFQATGANELGGPDETRLLGDWTADPSNWDRHAPGELRYFRCRVELDPDVALEFLRVPFRF